jgi:hypothetical protein
LRPRPTNLCTVSFEPLLLLFYTYTLSITKAAPCDFSRPAGKPTNIATVTTDHQDGYSAWPRSYASDRS